MTQASPTFEHAQQQLGDGRSALDSVIVGQQGVVAGIVTAVFAGGHVLMEGLPRLLLQLRYEEGLTLGQVSRLAGLGNPQRADRRLREILQRLREGMSQAENRWCCP